jgi:F0F1-type ATP synthase membrane subunit b/b'
LGLTVRKALIAAGFFVFILYCWAANVHQNEVDVPGYRVVEIDLLGGVSRDAWEENQSARFQRLMDLEGQRYQPPADAADRDPSRPLTAADFAAVIAANPGQPVRMAVRDSSAFSDLLSHKYLLRDNIADPADPRGMPLYLGGRLIDKPMLDDLRRRGIGTITVSGHASPVNFEIGTSLMIAVIFFTLAAALKPVVWTPFVAMLEKRRRELDIGSEAERQNQLEAVRFEEEKRRRHILMERGVQELRMAGQREAAMEAGAIVREARNREKEVKLAGLRDISRAADAARADVEQRIPELAQAIAQALTPGAGRPQEEK